MVAMAVMVVVAVVVVVPKSSSTVLAASPTSTAAASSYLPEDASLAYFCLQVTNVTIVVSKPLN